MQGEKTAGEDAAPDMSTLRGFGTRLVESSVWPGHLWACACSHRVRMPQPERLHSSTTATARQS